MVTERDCSSRSRCDPVVRKYSIEVGVSSVVCASGLWHGLRTGQGRAEEGAEGANAASVVTLNTIMSSASAKAINARGGRQRQFAQRLRYARVGRGDASKHLDTYEERGPMARKKAPSNQAAV